MSDSSEYVPVLKHLGEMSMMEDVKKAALKRCDEQVQQFARCTRGRYFSVLWACRESLRRMNDCVAQYTTEEYRAERREQYAKEHPHLVKEWVRRDAAVNGRE
ncbi:hypothetical protein CDCA_CDCA14G3764 [Cyanidium caldarium]|uniref:COX assembly mitochondrial protein n=1 Tax=Cyanidium caldarium TaxID=2771 RepID=A0AAV9J085_CYACA|nr:hypothetical protein CDCA_CDCA14G3764 [Cyanidium caldarium]